MTLKYFPFISSAILYLMLSACMQESASQKKANPSIGEKQENPVREIAEQAEADTLKGSLKAEAHGKIGSANVKIMYHSPAVRDRVVWGGLVPFDRVWVTGAHSATSLQTDQELALGGKKLPAGKYAIFTIPGKKEWQFIINKNWQQHLADNYSDKEDLIRITLKAENMPDNQERLRYQILTGSADEGEIVMSWEKVKLSLPVK